MQSLYAIALKLLQNQHKIAFKMQALCKGSPVYQHVSKLFKFLSSSLSLSSKTFLGPRARLLTVKKDTTGD